MTAAKSGDTVNIHYKGRYNGEVFYNSIDSRDVPFKFQIGKSDVPAWLNEGILGMKEGEKKKVKAPPEKAFGHFREELVVKMDRSELPDGIVPARGIMLQGTAETGVVINATIIDFDDKSVTLDGNHRLAGKTVEFEIHLLQII